VVERTVGVLEASVAVKQRVGIRMDLSRPLKGVKNQSIVIVISDRERHNSSIVQIQNGAQIDFVHGKPFVVTELRNIRQPLLIGLGGMKFAIQEVFREMLGIVGSSRATMGSILDRGLQVFGSTKSKGFLVGDLDVVIMA